MSDTTIDFKKHPHRRKNILTGEWLLVSPQRTQRPWQGKIETLTGERRPQYDPDCYLCPGNKRAGGAVNPDYKTCLAFTNDYSSLEMETPDRSVNENNLLMAKSQSGICRVICFSPRHDLTLPQLSIEDIYGVLELLQHEFESLSANKQLKYILSFENK